MTADMWEAEWRCAGRTEEGCGSLITVRTYLAIVQGHGTEVSCAACRARYVVTENGAQMVRNGIDIENVYPTPAGQYNIAEPVPPWNPHWEDPT